MLANRTGSVVSSNRTAGALAVPVGGRGTWLGFDAYNPGSAVAYLQAFAVEAEDVVLGEYTGSSEEEAQLPGDDLLLTYGRITYTVWPQNPDGSLGEPVTVSWDVERNQAG